MKITLVVAIAENGIIGAEGGLPWRLSTDMKRFKERTMGRPVIMGRKTWESFPRRPLPGRRNVVVTRDAAYLAEGAETAGSLDEAIGIAKADRPDEIYVIGGGEIYRQAMSLADCLDVTHVLAAIAGDTSFPEIDPAVWEPVATQEIPAGEKDSHATRHVVYRRRSGRDAGAL